MATEATLAAPVDASVHSDSKLVSLAPPTDALPLFPPLPCNLFLHRYLSLSPLAPAGRSTRRPSPLLLLPSAPPCHMPL